MAELIIDGVKKIVTDGGAILEACEDLGVPFNCQEGECGTCLILIQKGMENLAPLNANEQAMRLRKGERLACQTRIVGGTVVATY